MMNLGVEACAGFEIKYSKVNYSIVKN